MTTKSDSAIGLPLSADGAGESTDAAVERRVLSLFDSSAASLLRYVTSFGLSADETEDIVQEVFLSLFHHLRLGRPEGNLRGWLFKVARNLALRQRRSTRRRPEVADVEHVSRHVDPTPNPEVRLALAQKASRMQAVFRALSEQDRQCLHLRSEGLRYREIAAALGMSLGGVAKSLARSMTRFANSERR